MNLVLLRIHFGQDAAEFLAAEKQDRSASAGRAPMSGLSDGASRTASPATSVISGACAGEIGGRSRTVM